VEELSPEGRVRIAGRVMTKRLMGNGYDNVAFYSGGVYQWTATGGELETSKTAAKPARVGADVQASAGVVSGSP